MSVKTVTIAALISLAAVGAASASSINAGKAQLAATLGVSASDYSLAELTALNTARNDNDATAFAHVLRKVETTDGTQAVGNLQRAAVLGVQPGRFTSAELTQLEAAKREGDTQKWQFIVSGENRVVAERGVSQKTLDILAASAARGSDK